MQKIPHANTFLHIFVTIYISNSTTSGTVFLIGQAGFLQTILIHMIGHADNRAITDLQILRRDFNAALTQIFDLATQMVQVDDHAIPHDVDHVFMKNSGRDEIQNK